MMQERVLHFESPFESAIKILLSILLEHSKFISFT
jgi:hypothetical protein